MILRPYRATVGNPRCAPIRPGAGTQIVPEFQGLLRELGITYRQWNYWQVMGWLSKKPWYEIINDETLCQRAYDLAEAARLRAMPLNELADLLATKELERL